MNSVRTPVPPDGSGVSWEPGDLIGRTIGNYEIKSLVDEGGMGIVYLAVHPVMGRRAAIKILRRAYREEPDMVVRFMNEARAANAIHHPNIVEIIDVGYLPEGPPYLKMEFLDGETLGQRLSRVGRLAPDEAVRLLDQAASALEAAHAAGIIHRDLKPDNMFVIPDPDSPGGERVKVVDFGIAKLEGSGMGPSVRTSGVLLGTPHYMSPEQCRSSGVDQRSDVYALGAILYEMLCGRPPFVAQTSIDVMMMHMVQLPRAMRDLFPEIPEPLDRLVLRALAKKPRERFASMSQLRAVLAGGPMPPFEGVESAPVSPVFSVLAAVRAAGYAFARRFWPWVLLAASLGIGGGWVAARQLRAHGQDRPRPPVFPPPGVMEPPVASPAISPPARPAPAESNPVSAPARSPRVRSTVAPPKKTDGPKKWMKKW